MTAQLSIFNDKGVQIDKLAINCQCDTNSIDLETINSTYIRVIRNNLRQFTSSTKSRGEVNFSNRKPWKQKGTGRARCGDAKSPHWRKGGVAFGPKPGGSLLTMNKKTSKLAWVGLLQDLIQKERIKFLDIDANNFKISTAAAKEILNKISGSEIVNNVVFLSSDMSSNFARSIFNIPAISTEMFGRENFLNLSTAKMVVVLKSDVPFFENLVARSCN